MPPLRIVVLVRPEDSFPSTTYLLKIFIEVWRAEGHEVLVHAGLGPPPPGDLAILHTDITVIPEAYLALARAYPRTLNGSVGDISKHVVSRSIVRRGDGYAGPVIVKTVANCAGVMEARAARRSGGLGRLKQAVRRRLPWYFRNHLDDYPIFNSPAAVPSPVWFNRDLFVERFQPERHEEFYCLRTWVFFGDRETHSISYSLSPVIKGSRVVRREPLAEVPAELREIRARLGFDYGKFDYAVVDGRPVLYDVNRTPGTGDKPIEHLQDRFTDLAAGLASFH